MVRSRLSGRVVLQDNSPGRVNCLSLGRGTPTYNVNLPLDPRYADRPLQCLSGAIFLRPALGHNPTTHYRFASNVGSDKGRSVPPCRPRPRGPLRCPRSLFRARLGTALVSRFLIELSGPDRTDRTVFRVGLIDLGGLLPVAGISFGTPSEATASSVIPLPIYLGEVVLIRAHFFGVFSRASVTVCFREVLVRDTTLNDFRVLLRIVCSGCLH
jgi:hypothetical protein